MDLEFIGPPLEEGPLPAVFYFALSAKDSLHLDPYNQPAVFLSKHRLRIFSFDLPAHRTFSPTEAMAHWREELEKGNDLITPFIGEVVSSIENLIKTNIVHPEKIGVMGLSRGAFIAAHVAAKMAGIKYILGFAPVTKFSHSPLSLLNLTDQLYNRTLRFYIGNRDTLVGTDHCFSFIHTLANTAFDRGIRSSPIELVITPSAGQHGHGTLPPIFRQGADWLAERLV